MNNKKTLVIGASEEPTRYANMAIKSLRKHGHDVVAIGKTTGNVMDVSFDKEKKQFEGIDTVTLYINPSHQEAYYDYILSLKPKRVIFNPGTENMELERMAEGEGIDTMEACTLVLLSTGQY